MLRNLKDHSFREAP
uniref:Uncharacterized protein n=1 Tax=Rhizophora mucronata TaxID=61149 RepID=A0A2P2MDL1_RHIMU